MTIILYYLLLCGVHMLQGALVLSNVHNRTSARDGPMFGSKGPSMNTSSLLGITLTGLAFQNAYKSGVQHSQCLMLDPDISYVHKVPLSSRETVP